MFQIWGYNEKQTKKIKMQKSSKKKKERKFTNCPLITVKT